MPVFCHCFKKLEAADTIPKVFLVFSDYFSFFNYHIIEYIINKLCTEKDKTELKSKVLINMQNVGSLNGCQNLDQ